MATERDRALLDRAVELSVEGMRADAGGPFGAVVSRAGEIVGEGFNRVTSTNDPTAHAEVVAIRAACRSLGTHSLEGCELYTSCEPCPMCLAASYWAGVERIVYANTREDAARIGFGDADFYAELSAPVDARKLATVRVVHPRAIEVFREWKGKADKVRY